MKRRWVPMLIATNLAVLIALAFVYPHLMVSPGPLIAGHSGLTTNCFACHSPWRGADPQRCTQCHAVTAIGLRTTKGIPLSERKVKTSFHQELIEQDCMACHGDHQGSASLQLSSKPFSHALLRPAIRERCQSCHAAPTDTIHRHLNAGCSQCHTPDHWKPATFDHAHLAKAVLERCETCHRLPSDSLHRQIKGNCGRCHSPEHWKPATFDHDKLFHLDRNHNTECTTCHTRDDFSQYTCYGCHEHQPDRVRAEHLEEGIRDFSDCVKCHRSASEEPGRNGARDGRERD